MTIKYHAGIDKVDAEWMGVIYRVDMGVETQGEEVEHIQHIVTLAEITDANKETVDLALKLHVKGLKREAVCIEEAYNRAVTDYPEVD